jgi:hypothetical protein
MGAKHYRPEPGDEPSWLTFIGHMKDSLWSVALFRCESIFLKTHWVLVIMDQFTRHIIVFGEHAGDVDGPALCRMFNKAAIGKGVPRYLSSDHDPLFRYHRGGPICGYERSRKSKPFPMCRYPIPLPSDLSAQSDANTLTSFFSGTGMILNRSWRSFRITTTPTGSTKH